MNTTLKIAFQLFYLLLPMESVNKIGYAVSKSNYRLKHNVTLQFPLFSRNVFCIVCSIISLLSSQNIFSNELSAIFVSNSAVITVHDSAQIFDSSTNVDNIAFEEASVVTVLGNALIYISPEHVLSSTENFVKKANYYPTAKIKKITNVNVAITKKKKDVIIKKNNFTFEDATSNSKEWFLQYTTITRTSISITYSLLALVTKDNNNSCKGFYKEISTSMFQSPDLYFQSSYFYFFSRPPPDFYC